MIPARMTAKFGATGVDNDREQESEFFLKTKVGIKIRANFQCTFFFSRTVTPKSRIKYSACSVVK